MTPAPGHDTVRDNNAARDDNAAQFGSSLVAMVTPMRPDGRVDLDAAGRLAGYLLAAGCDGLVVAGSRCHGPILGAPQRCGPAMLFRGYCVTWLHD